LRQQRLLRGRWWGWQPQTLQRRGDVHHQRLDAFGHGQVLVQRLLEIDRRQFEVLLQHEIVEIENLAELGSEALTLE
jgi:hypothetical protein